MRVQRAARRGRMAARSELDVSDFFHDPTTTLLLVVFFARLFWRASIAYAEGER